MQIDRRIVVGNRGTTDRTARWACEQVGRHNRSVSEVADTLEDRSYCPEIYRLGRMLRRWAPQIAAWHH